jgi:hypothetical protein
MIPLGARPASTCGTSPPATITDRFCALALYQQRPAPAEGDYFKAEWLHTYETLPDRASVRIYGASDYAVTADGGDYTVHIVAVDPQGRMYVVDLWRKQARLCRPDLLFFWRRPG